MEFFCYSFVVGLRHYWLFMDPRELTSGFLKAPCLTSFDLRLMMSFSNFLSC